MNLTRENITAFLIGFIIAAMISMILRVLFVNMPWTERTYDISKRRLEDFENRSKQTIRQLDDNEIVNARILIDINKDLLWLYKQKGLLIENGKVFAIRDYNDYLNQVGGKK